MSTYMAFLPYPVRHSRNVSPAAKLLYAELTTFTDKHASTKVKNADLCALFGVDERSISRWLIELKKEQFIEVFQNGPERTITITFDRKSTPTKMSGRTDKNVGVTPTKMSGNTLYTSFSNEKGGTIEVVSTDVQQHQPEIPGFVPPKLDDVIKFAECNSIPVNTAVKFWNYYDACEWELRPGVRMRRWQGLLRNWKVTDDTRQDQKRQREQVSAILNAPAVELVSVNTARAEDLSRIDAAYRNLEVGGAQ